jgi:hypothetical protein
MGERAAAAPGRVTSVVCLALLVAVSASGCGGKPDPLAGKDATPPIRTAAATSVDVCHLLSPGNASRVLQRPLLVVGRTVGPARDTTVQCEIGQGFDDPLVVVSLAPEPVARDVFDDAYGNRAGGDPVLTHNLGDTAYTRTEGDQRAIHVLVHGSVLSVSVPFGPTGEAAQVTKEQLVMLTRIAVGSLPANPVVEPMTAPRQCNAITAHALSDTLGRPPTVDAGLVFSPGSLTCSWGGQPGSVTVSVTDDVHVMAAFRASHTLSAYVRVPDVVPLGTGSAFSSNETAGDLVVFVDDRLMMRLDVVPAAGYTGPDIDTTDGERTLAEQLLAELSS